jgi:muramoyltetrapeptide carboxypeptidase
MKILKPSRLKSGDLIGIITPASAPKDISRIEKSVKYFEKLGFKVEVGKNVGKSYGYLAGTDKQRLEDIHYMFSKKEVKAVICARGGYGTPRLLEKIDYELISKNPKIFVGYSDITSLQLALLYQCGLVTFAGPMAAVDFWDEVNKYTEENFWKLLTSNKKFGKVNLPLKHNLKIHWAGKSEGRIVGGNLAHLIASFGTPYHPKYKNKILLIEDVDEAPYRIDRMLSQLKHANVFEKISGLIFGQFTDCEEKDNEKPTLTLEQVFEDFIKDMKIPVVSNFPHGHVKETMTIPYGIEVELNATKEYLEFLEPAVE